MLPILGHVKGKKANFKLEVQIFSIYAFCMASQDKGVKWWKSRWRHFEDTAAPREHRKARFESFQKVKEPTQKEHLNLEKPFLIYRRIFCGL